MLILSRVCADFHNAKGELIHWISPANRLSFHEAPEAIREDPLFRMLVDEGSLEASVTPVEKKQLEADLCSGTLSVDALTEKSKRLPLLEAELDEKSFRWLELSEIEA